MGCADQLPRSWAAARSVPPPASTPPPSISQSARRRLARRSHQRRLQAPIGRQRGDCIGRRCIGRTSGSHGATSRSDIDNLVAGSNRQSGPHRGRFEGRGGSWPCRARASQRRRSKSSRISSKSISLCPDGGQSGPRRARGGARARRPAREGRRVSPTLTGPGPQARPGVILTPPHDVTSTGRC